MDRPGEQWPDYLIVPTADRRFLVLHRGDRIGERATLWGARLWIRRRQRAARKKDQA